MNRWKLWTGFVLVFTAGALFGVAAMVVYVRAQIIDVVHGGPPRSRAMIMRALGYNLSLTQEQREAVEPIVGEAQKAALELRYRGQPEFEAIMKQAADRMKPLLTEEQQLQLERMRETWRTRWRITSQDMINDLSARKP